MADNSFDIVSKVDAQEMDNAINQTLKEIQTRYDLKDTKSDLEYNRNDLKITLTAPDDFKIKAILEILKQKMIKRGISLKTLNYKDIQKAAGDTVKQEIEIQQGIPKEKAKDIIKDIKDAKLKVQAQMQDEQIRVSAKKIDDLQAVIQLLRSKDYDLPLQFSNYR